MDWHPVAMPMSAALHRLSHGFQPSARLMRALVELRSEDIKCPLVPKTLRLDGDRLLVKGEIESAEGSLGEAAFDKMTGLRLTGQCEDGTVFSARDAVVKSRRQKTPPIVEVVFGSDDWDFLKPGAQTILWAGTTDAELPRGRGNLKLTAKEGSISLDHYCLAGQRYTYYFIRHVHRGESRWILAVDPGEKAELDRHVLGCDLMSIAFSFGCPFTVSRLYGLDENGAQVGVLRTGFDERFSGRPRKDPPVPQHVVEAPWPVLLFDALSSHFEHAEAPEAAWLTAALQRFLNALYDSPGDSFALTLLHAAHGAARRVLDAGVVSLAADRQPSEDGVSRSQDVPETLAGPAMPPGELFSAGRRAERPSAITLIHAALTSARLTMPDEMVAAVTSADEELLGERAEERPDDERAAYLRTVLAALIAKKVGYNGPLCGWEKSPSHRSDASDGGGHRFKFFFADLPESLELPGVRELWPRFRLPKVPVEGPIAAVAALAEGLEAKTDGLVVARVKPLPQRPGEPVTFDFVLHPANRPAATTVLFSMEETGDGGLLVRGFEEDEEEERVLKGDAGVASFLKEVASGEVTRNRVQELMVIAEDRAAQ